MEKGGEEPQEKKEEVYLDQKIEVPKENIDEDCKEKNKDFELSGKVKRWSKLLKYSMPSKSSEKESQKKTESKERKSLKDKMKENDFVVFLTERRAVSESRFKVMDAIGNPNHLVRTKSDQSLKDESWNSGISSGSVKDLKSKFEDEELNFDIQILEDHSPSVVDNAAEGVEKKPNEEVNNSLPEPKRLNAGNKSTGSSDSKINESSQDSSNDGKGVKKDELVKTKTTKKDKKEKKDKKKPCTICKTPKEHKEHRREKKRAKREKAEKADKAADSKIVSTPETLSENFKVSPHKVTGEKFFQQLLLREELEKPKAERLSRPRKQNKEKKPYVKSSQPTLGVFLKGKQPVSDSIFKHYDQVERYLENHTLPRGVIRNEESPVRTSSSFGGPIFPRSISNLERISSRKNSAERPNSTMSNTSESSDKRSFSLPRPISSLSERSDASFIIDHVEYRNYVYEMVHSTPKNERFCKLQSYFSTLDRVIKLESAASKMEIHKLKSEDIVDFDTWRAMRKKEKAQDELDYLLTDLKKAQKEREFNFRPREVENFRWKGDSRLRVRDRSIEDLKSIFNKKGATGELDFTMSLPKNFAKQGGWLEKQEARSKIKEPDAFSTYPNSRNIQSPYSFLNTQRSRSSLSNDQVSSLKNQLNDILSNRPSSAASSQQSSRSPSRHEFTIEVNEKAKPLENLFVQPVPEMVRKSLEEAERNLETYSKERSRSKEDEERLKISKTINDELMKRVNFKEECTQKKVNFNTKDSKVPLVFQRSTPKRDTSPRVCYSLEIEQNEDKTMEHNESSDFLLVLSDNETKNPQVTEIIDKWASADSEEENKRMDGKMKKKSRLLGGFSSQSSDSISSGTSMHTVIYQPPMEKLDIKTIEEVEIPDNVHEKSFEEIRKSFENVEYVALPEPISLVKEDHNIPVNKVKETKKSFEIMPDEKDTLDETGPTKPPRTPVRSSSFHRAIGRARQNQPAPQVTLDKDSPQSKSASSIPEILQDEGYSTFPNSPRKPNRNVTYLEKSYIPEKSISNVDLTDTENTSLDETFGKMHEKVHSLGESTDGKLLIFSRNSAYSNKPSDPSKYSRAYLRVAKTGDVRDKRMQFERCNGNIVKILPAVNPEFIKKHATDSSKVVIKNQEVANLNQIKSRLEKCANKSDDIVDYCGAMLNKNKLKNLCKKMGHSKILSKMSSLQKNGKLEDDGFDKLNFKSKVENDYVKKYHSGDINIKKSIFEGAPQNSQMEEKEAPSFRWSQRFEKDMPNLGNSYTNAQKQNQFRSYYGYHAGDGPRIPNRTDSRTYSKNLDEFISAGSRRPIYLHMPGKPSITTSMPCDQPTSLPMFQLNSTTMHPPYLPPPPYREHISLGM